MTTRSERLTAAADKYAQAVLACSAARVNNSAAAHRLMVKAKEELLAIAREGTEQAMHEIAENHPDK